LTVSGTSGSDSTTKSLPLTLNDAAPGAVSLASPSDGASNVALSPILSWNAASSGGPTSYLVEVASDAAFANVVFSTTVADQTSVTVTPALDSLTEYFWRVTASNTCGAAAASSVFHFTTLAAPGTCTPPTTEHALFADDVESGNAGWTTTGSSGDVVWDISTARPASGTSSWYAEDYDGITDQRLISPTIALPADENPVTLRFESWQDIEQSSGGCFDAAIVEVSTDGTTFTQLPDAAIISGGAYTGIVDDGYSNPLADLEAWCGTREYSDGPVVVDLTAYAGQSVQLRFRLGSDESVGHEGWYVDDVSVSSCAAGGPVDVIFANGFEATP
jgi:hypothetical protein